MMHTAYIAMGSNLGNKEANIRCALNLLQQSGVQIIRVSTLINTEPYGVTDQPVFCNGVCCIKTELDPRSLLKLLLATEKKMGRVRLRHWGERNIDLDLLLYEDISITSDELVLPHPDMQNRDFVLIPMAEIAPEIMHPILKKSMKQLKKELLEND